MREADALKRLFTAVFQLPISNGQTFNQHISSQWSALVPNVASQQDIDIALSILGMKLTFIAFVPNSFASNYANLVYGFRNAIVHNKETEFHLTYASMDSTLCCLLENFLLPSLEQICFALISEPNDILWYQNKELQLYR